jgi:hypothetical protein
MIRSFTLLLTMALALVVLGGCGGGGSDGGGKTTEPSSGLREGSETVETSSLSKPQYIAKAEAICGHATENLLKPLFGYMHRHANQPNQSEGELIAAAIQTAVLPKFQTQIDELRNLGAPSGDEKQIEAFLAAMQRGIDSLAQRNELAHITDLDRELQQAGELALDYGIVNCAN